MAIKTFLNISYLKTPKSVLDKYEQDLDDIVSDIFAKITTKPEKDSKFRGKLKTPDQSTDSIKEVLRLFKKYCCYS